MVVQYGGCMYGKVESMHSCAELQKSIILLVN